ncbi:MAG: hypothetical protein AAF826_06035 [Pseudomonadota bacterium]
MSNTDSFIDEVSEELRNDRLYAALRKYGWIGVVGILLIVGGVVLSEARQARQAAEAQASGDALLAAIEAGTPAEQAAALGAISDTNPNAAFVAELLRAQALAETGQADEALASLDAAAAAAPNSVVYADLIVLKKVLLPGVTLSGAERVELLTPLTRGGRPYRLSAQEQLAYAQLAAGDEEAALATFDSVARDAEVSREMRGRAEQMIVVLGGTTAEQ